MKFKDFLRASKTISDPGKWVYGKPAKKLLELSKGKLSLGAQWTWRKMVIQANGSTFHVAIAFHEAKQNYVAYLALVRPDDVLVLASIENHGTHPGWHMHVNCSGEGGANYGRLQYPTLIRIPQSKATHRDRKIKICEASGMRPVLDYFRLAISDDSGPQATFKL